VEPPPSYARIRRRAEATAAPAPDDDDFGWRLRATYRGYVGVFDLLSNRLVEKLAPQDPLRDLFQELLEEMASRRPGSRAMVETLLRRCLLLLLRRCCGRRAPQFSRLAAFDEGGIGRALAAMQDRPEKPFTLTRLAEVAGMSRSVFASHFREALGQSPMEHLKVLRLALAAQLLTRTSLPVKVIAARAGYSSRSSFSRAFLSGRRLAPARFRAAADEPRPSRSVVRPIPPGQHGGPGRPSTFARASSRKRSISPVG
jgi:AraC family transcriptional regulator, activator of mtrCDE